MRDSTVGHEPQVSHSWRGKNRVRYVAVGHEPHARPSHQARTLYGLGMNCELRAVPNYKMRTACETQLRGANHVHDSTFGH